MPMKDSPSSILAGGRADSDTTVCGHSSAKELTDLFSLAETSRTGRLLVSRIVPGPPALRKRFSMEGHAPTAWH